MGALLVGALGLAACSSGPNSMASSTTSTSISTASGLALHVTPNVNLHNGEVVHVSVSGFPPGKAFLSECASVADVSAEGCGAQLAAQPFAEIESGSGTQNFTVANQAATMPLTPQPSLSCTNQCVLVATSGVPASGAQHTQTATLAFGSRDTRSDFSSEHVHDVLCFALITHPSGEVVQAGPGRVISCAAEARSRIGRTHLPVGRSSKSSGSVQT
jgi:hypothetical protein